MATAPDEILIERLDRGDESALRELVDRYYQQLCIFSVQFTESVQESEDIVQELFVRLWEKHLYRGVSNLKAWLFISVRNISLSVARSKFGTESLDSAELNAYAEWEEGFTEDEIAARCSQLEEALRCLSPKEYAVLMEIIVNDRRYQDVADDMDVSVNTVKSHLQRAMKKLRGGNLLVYLILFNQISVTQIQ